MQRRHWWPAIDRWWLRCDRVPEAILPFRMSTINYTIQWHLGNLTAPTIRQTAKTKTKSNAIFISLSSGGWDAWLTSLASAWALEQTGFWVRGRRRSRTAVRIWRARATAGPSKQLWAAVTRPANDAKPCLFSCPCNRCSASTNSP